MGSSGSGVAVSSFRFVAMVGEVAAVVVGDESSCGVQSKAFPSVRKECRVMCRDFVVAEGWLEEGE